MTNIRHKNRRACRKAAATGAFAARSKPALRTAEKSRDQRHKAGPDQAKVCPQRQSAQETGDQAKPGSHPATVKSP